MFLFLSRGNSSASFEAKNASATAICRGRSVVFSGKDAASFQTIAKELGWEKNTDNQYDVPEFTPKDERERIRLPHFLTFAAKIHQQLKPNQRLGYVIGFDLVRQWEPVNDTRKESNLPDALFYLFDNVTPIKTEPPLHSAPIRGSSETDAITSDLPKDEFASRVNIAKDYFSRGELMEVVLAREFSGSFFGNPRDFFETYRSLCPSPYEFFIEATDFMIAGCSPETMVRIKNREVLLRPISGTVRFESDIPYLLSSTKEKAELDMLIDLGRNDVSRVCKPGVRVEDYRALLRLTNVIHTYASVSGTLRDDFEPFHALASAINAGTLTGAPKVAAMELIAKLEPTRRGFYGGAIGVALPGGEIDSAITIRTAVIQNQTIQFRTGATLLHASEPEREYEETENKARALKRAYAIYQKGLS